jgi:hypothetical protein
MKRSVCIICCLSILASQAPPSLAQTEFKKTLQKKYDFRTVSCYTCHSRKAEVPEDQQAAFKENAKKFHNAFGKEFVKLLKGKEATKRLADVKKLASDDPEKTKVKDEVNKEFLEALKKVETMESTTGETYGELLKTATLKGVKPR